MSVLFFQAKELAESRLDLTLQQSLPHVENRLQDQVVKEAVVAYQGESLFPVVDRPYKTRIKEGNSNEIIGNKVFLWLRLCLKWIRSIVVNKRRFFINVCIHVRSQEHLYVCIFII